MDASQIGKRAWSYAGVLQDAGLSCFEYVEQLTLLLFLKMADQLFAIRKNDHIRLGFRGLRTKRCRQQRKNEERRRQQSTMSSDNSKWQSRISHDILLISQSVTHPEILRTLTNL